MKDKRPKSEAGSLHGLKELLLSPRTFQLLVELASDLVALHCEGKVLYINARGAELLGISDPAQIIGRPVLDFVNTASKPIAKERIELLLQEGGNSPTYEQKILRPDGTEIDLEFRGTTVPYGDKKAVLLIARDITLHKRITEDLQQKNELLHQLAQNVRDVFWVRSSDEVLYVNPAYETLYGRSCSELYRNPHSFLDAILPEDRERIRQAYLQEDGHGYFDEEYRIVRPDGSTRWVWARSVPIRKADWVAHRVGIAEDITIRKETEEALRRSETKYRELAEKSLDGFARTALDGTILEVNKAFETMLGYTTDELKGLTIQEITPEKWHPYMRKMASEALKTGHTSLWEKEYRKKDGSLIPIELRLHVSRDEKGKATCVWAFVRDITDRKGAEEELKAYADLLEAKNREMRDFVYMASHDLQEPLRKIRIFSDRLMDAEVLLSEEEQRYFLGRMQAAAERMQKMINGLLSYSRVSTKVLPFTRVNLRIVLTEALSILELRIEEAGADIQVGDLPTIEADPSQMVQLFQNLLDNALKFHRQDTRPKIKIYSNTIPSEKDPVSAAQRDRFCSIFVEDNGIGFEEKHLDRIFVPFERLHGMGSFAGTGIGLAICRKISERHGGTITARSEKGKGSTFIIELPTHQQKKAPHCPRTNQ